MGQSKRKVRHFEWDRESIFVGIVTSGYTLVCVYIDMYICTQDSSTEIHMCEPALVYPPVAMYQNSIISYKKGP